MDYLSVDISTDTDNIDNSIFWDDDNIRDYSDLIKISDNGLDDDDCWDHNWKDDEQNSGYIESSDGSTLLMVNSSNWKNDSRYSNVNPSDGEFEYRDTFTMNFKWFYNIWKLRWESIYTTPEEKDPSDYKYLELPIYFLDVSGIDTFKIKINYESGDPDYIDFDYSEKENCTGKEGICAHFRSIHSTAIQIRSTKKIRFLGKMGGDSYLLREQARRIIAATVALGRNWRYGKVLNSLKDGIELNPPIFDSDIVELVSIDSIGIKSAVLISEAGIKTKKEFLSANPHRLSQKISRVKEIKNNELRRYNSRSKDKIPMWRGISEKTLEKMQNTKKTKKDKVLYEHL